eukprot:gene12394-biopygen9879
MDQLVRSAMKSSEDAQVESENEEAIPYEMETASFEVIAPANVNMADEISSRTPESQESCIPKPPTKKCLACVKKSTKIKSLTQKIRRWKAKSILQEKPIESQQQFPKAKTTTQEEKVGTAEQINETFFEGNLDDDDLSSDDGDSDESSDEFVLNSDDEQNSDTSNDDDYDDDYGTEGGTATTTNVVRHKGITKWMKESQNLTSHFYDIWHVARTITKKLAKSAKEKHCEILLEWVKAVRNHLYWAATTTKSGFGDLIAAKWTSFMRHVANVHENHPNELYKKCSHEENLADRNWIKIGTPAYDKLQDVLMNKRIVNDIKKLSSDAQTSCLEGFHATLNHWHPKMISFSWMGTICRKSKADAVQCHKERQKINSSQQLFPPCVEQDQLQAGMLQAATQTADKVKEPSSQPSVCNCSDEPVREILTICSYI